MATELQSAADSSPSVVAPRRNRTFGKRRPTIQEVAPRVFRFRVVLGLDSRGEPVRRLFTVRGSRKDAERKLDEVLKGVRDGQSFAAKGQKVGPWIASWIAGAEGVKARATLDGYRKLAAVLPPWFNALPLAEVTPAAVERMLRDVAGERRRVLVGPDGTPWTAARQKEYEKALRRFERAQKVPASERARRRKAVRLAEQGEPTRPEPPRETEGAPRGTRVVTAVRAMVRAAFSKAVKRGLMDRNVASGEFIEAPRHEASRRRALTREEASALWSAAAAHPRGAFVLLLMSTGLRPSEALALRWDDVADGVLRIEASLTWGKGGGWERKAPKTQAGIRRVTIEDPDLLAAIERERTRYDATRAHVLALGEAWCDDGYIFSTSRGTPLDVRGADRRLLRPLIEAAIATAFEGAPRSDVEPFKGVSLYCLRHTTATAMMRAEVPLAVVAQTLGHADPKFTARQYQHASLEDSRVALSKAVGLFKAKDSAASPTAPPAEAKVLPFGRKRAGAR